jgi:hypothetical protein
MTTNEPAYLKCISTIEELDTFLLNVESRSSTQIASSIVNMTPDTAQNVFAFDPQPFSDDVTSITELKLMLDVSIES